MYQTRLRVLVFGLLLSMLFCAISAGLCNHYSFLEHLLPGVPRMYIMCTYAIHIPGMAMMWSLCPRALSISISAYLHIHEQISYQESKQVYTT